MRDDSLLGRSYTDAYRGLVKGILERQTTRRYTFISLEAHKAAFSDGGTKATRTFIDEILYRAHAAALAAIARAYTWSEACETAHRSKNFYGACAALRGLMEAAGDASLALGRATTYLASYQAIFLTLRSRPTGFMPDSTITQILEDDLIHFLYGRRLKKSEKKSAPETHDADRKTTEYIRAISPDQFDQFVDLWGDLCEITHPAAPSLFPFIEFHEDELRFRRRSYEECLAWLLDKRGAQIERVLQCAFNRPLMTIGVLNSYGISKLSTGGLSEKTLTGISGWKQLVDLMTSSVNEVKRRFPKD